MKLPINYKKSSWIIRKQAREEYIALQNGLCYYCGEPLSGPPNKEVEGAYIKTKLFPEGFFQYPIHLHHDHNTGMTIGAVHSKCNAVLWQYHGE